MKTYKTNNGALIQGETAEQLVNCLNEASLFGKCETLAQFMTDTAAACKMQTGAEIRHSNCDEFIDDLEHRGFILIPTL